MDGWIKLHRKIWDNPIVKKDVDHFMIWMYLLTHATHRPMDVVFGGKRITLQPGSIVTGREIIATECNSNRSKVERVLKLFESEQQIEQQTSTKNRIISILNWDKYQISEQQNEQQVSNKRATSEQQVSTNKNVRTKESKKEDKREYADYVFLTETEYGKLSELLGHELESYFLRFGSWISGKSEKEQKNRSAYLTILNWHRDRPSRGSSTIAREGKASHHKETPKKYVEKEVPMFFGSDSREGTH